MRNHLPPQAITGHQRPVLVEESFAPAPFLATRLPRSGARPPAATAHQGGHRKPDRRDWTPHRRPDHSATAAVRNQRS